MEVSHIRPMAGVAKSLTICCVLQNSAVAAQLLDSRQDKHTIETDHLTSFSCGSTSEYCGVGCQNGPCLSSATAASTSSAVAATTPAPFSLSTDGTCGFKQQLVCAGSTFGNCCSAAGYCGSKQYHCSSLLGW